MESDEDARAHERDDERRAAAQKAKTYAAGYRHGRRSAWAEVVAGALLAGVLGLLLG